MNRRRETYSPLAPSRDPRWLVTRSMPGSLIEALRLEAGSDLKRAFLVAMLALIDEGWQLGEFHSTSASVFHSRGAERRVLSLEVLDPDT